MNFIKAEEFLKQPEEIQKVFIDWWEPSIGDLATNKHGDLSVLKESRDIKAVKIYKGQPYAIPLFTEGQLREFIEDKTGCYLSCSSPIYKGYGYDITFLNTEITRTIKTDSLLKALWKVALEIAKESVKNE